MLRCLMCVLSSQTELNDGIAMIVGNNDRMQGIISQLELACSTIEVSGPVSPSACWAVNLQACSTIEVSGPVSPSACWAVNLPACSTVAVGGPVSPRCPLRRSLTRPRRSLKTPAPRSPFCLFTRFITTTVTLAARASSHALRQRR